MQIAGDVCEARADFLGLACSHPMLPISARRRKSVAPIEQIPSPSERASPIPLCRTPRVVAPRPGNSVPGDAVSRNKASNPSEAEIPNRPVILAKIPGWWFGLKWSFLLFPMPWRADLPANRQEICGFGGHCSSIRHLALSRGISRHPMGFLNVNGTRRMATTADVPDASAAGCREQRPPITAADVTSMADRPMLP